MRGKTAGKPCFLLHLKTFLTYPIHFLKKNRGISHKKQAERFTFAVQNFGIMLAIVKIAGQQFKVKAGDQLYVPHLTGKTGDHVEFSDVLMTDNGSSVHVGSQVNAVVKAEIVTDLVKGDKVIAFKMKRRKGFRKKHGHRTQYTKIKVTAIS
jgi:large subunit ribosomal protein L21